MREINFVLAQWGENFVFFAACLYVISFVMFAWDFISYGKVIVSVDGVDSGSSSGGRFARMAVILAICGCFAHFFGVLLRGLAASRVPWGNMYEFGVTGSFIILLVFLLLLVRYDLKFLGMFIMGLVILILGTASLGFYTPVANLVPALQSYWLVIHVSVAVLSSGFFTVAFALSVLQLVKSRFVLGEEILASGVGEGGFASVGEGSGSGVVSVEYSGGVGRVGGSFFRRVLLRVPDVVSLEGLSYRLNAVAFVMWTFTLIAGAIWAYHAWGRYWGWDPKEVWTFVIWVVYAGYLHARATPGWSPSRVAWISIFGYICIIFNFTVVNIFFSGLHSYA